MAGRPQHYLTCKWIYKRLYLALPSASKGPHELNSFTVSWSPFGQLSFPTLICSKPAKPINKKKGLSLKVGRGRGTWTWDVGRGTWGRGDVGTLGLGEVVREDFGTRGRAGIRGRDKQITPVFCAELVKYFF